MSGRRVVVQWIEAMDETWVDTDLDGAITPGDFYLFTNNDLAIPGTMYSARTSGECIVLPSSDNTFCTTTFTVKGRGENVVLGTFTALGVFEDSMSISGGTGCFQGMAGFVDGRDTELEDGYAYEFIIDVYGGVTQNTNAESSCTPGNLFDMVWTESGGRDSTIDYDRDDENSGGDVYISDEYDISVGNTTLTGLSAGRCTYLQLDSDETFCRVIFYFNEGEIALQGYYSKMTIVGAGGCFLGIRGSVQGNDKADFYENTFHLAAF